MDLFAFIEHQFDTGAVTGRLGAAAEVEGVTAGASSARLSGERALAVLDPLRAVLPGGLQRGSTLVVRDVSLALAVTAGPAQAGGWVAGLGLAGLGLVAAGQLGVPLERLVLVAGPSGAALWANAAAVLVDSFAVVLVGGRHRVSAAVCRRLSARARDRGAVLVVVGDALGWPEVPDVTLAIDEGWEWEGLDGGAGHLSRRRVVVTAQGRRGASRPRRASLWLPTTNGDVAAIDGPPAVDVAPVAEVQQWGA